MKVRRTIFQTILGAGYEKIEIWNDGDLVKIFLGNLDPIVVPKGSQVELLGSIKEINWILNEKVR